jgi:glyoxylase-like metal-dependent hydrolase (beta-lactamase superfamily II)
MAKYQIKPITLMTGEADKSAFTYMCFPGVKLINDIAYFMIEGTPNKSGRVLVDTGTWQSLFNKYWPGPGKDLQTFEESLAKERMKADDVDIIIQTHLHHDHIGNTSKCRKAEVYIQEDEWAFAAAPHPLQAQYYPQELFDGWKVRLIRGDYELFPGLRILHTPGHTPGTQSVAVETAEGTAVIAGFCSIYQTFQKPADVLGAKHPFRSWKAFSQGIATDINQSYSSVLRVKSLADILFPCHGPGFCADTKKYLDV